MSFTSVTQTLSSGAAREIKVGDVVEILQIPWNGKVQVVRYPEPLRIFRRVEKITEKGGIDVGLLNSVNIWMANPLNAKKVIQWGRSVFSPEQVRVVSNEQPNTVGLYRVVSKQDLLKVEKARAASGV